MFFHCKVLHKSAENTSENRRWALLIAYNTKENNPAVDYICPCYTPLEKVTLFTFIYYLCISLASLADIIYKYITSLRIFRYNIVAICCPH